MQFKTVYGEVVDFATYCLQQKRLYPNLKIHIGTDSIVKERQIIYITVIAFRHSKTGVHFIYNKEKIPSLYKLSGGKPDIKTRLFKEGQMTIELAEEIVATGAISKTELVLEFDYNNIVKTVSTSLINSVEGWAKGIGYNEVLLKSDNQIACKAANQICNA